MPHRHGAGAWSVLAGIILGRPWLVIGLIAAVSVLALPAATGLRIENELPRYFQEGADSVREYEAAKARFGNDSVILVTLEAASGELDAEVIRVAGRLTDEIAALPGVAGVNSVTTVSVVHGEGGWLEIDRLVPDPADVGEEELARIRDILADYPLLQENVVSSGLDALAIAVRWAETPGDEGTGRADLVAMLNDIVNRPGLAAWQPRISGFYVVEAAVNQWTFRDVRRFVPLTLAVVCLLVLVLQRSLPLVLVVALEIVLPFLWVAAVMVLLDVPFMFITSLLPVLLITIAVADIIHFGTDYRAHRAGSDGGRETRRRTLTESLRRVGPPCLLTSLTTAVGFLALLSSDIRPIQEFGALSAFGVMLDFALTITLVPAVLLLMPSTRRAGAPSAPPASAAAGGWLPRLADAVIGRPLALLVAFLAATTLLAGGVALLRVETNFVEFLPTDSRVYRDTLYIEDRFGGVMPLWAHVTTGRENGLREPEVLHAMDDYAEGARRLPEVGNVLSLADYVKEVNRVLTGGGPESRTIPDDGDAIAQALLLYELASENEGDLGDVASYDYREGLVRIRGVEHRTETAARLIHKLTSETAEAFAAVEAEATLTGITSLFVDMVTLVLDSQVRSFLLVAVAIWLVFTLLFRSLRLGLIAMGPNIFPIALCLGLMGYAGIPLDVTTVMIASVLFGIAVDDTIHFLYRYRWHRDAGSDTASAIRETLSTVGVALVRTSVVLAAGFGILVSGSFEPTVSFGVLLVAGVLGALVADLLLLPALLLRFGDGRPARQP